MRLIDADELITAFPCGESVRTESVRATINHMPTIEVSEDCISREWVYNELTKVTAVTPTQIDMLSDFTDIIKYAPSVVPTQTNANQRVESVESVESVEPTTEQSSMVEELLKDIEDICKDIRERHVDDSVCGLCEYDADHGLDGYANECPGFERDDCFKLSEEYKAKMKG